VLLGALLAGALHADDPPTVPTVTTAPTVTVVPGARYAAGRLRRFFLGAHYRDLWTTPLRVPVLDLAAFAGGLTPAKRGGGMQTKSLRLLGRDGREYAFRSLDKDPSKTLPPELRETFARDLVQDQISSSHPAAPLVAARLAESAGVLHVEPRLVVLPDDPALGEFRAEFGGMLGYLEERPDVTEEGGAFAGASKVIGTERLLERLRDDPREEVDARAFLRARLLDLLIGDWDRHEDQWRWARTEGKTWQPVPRDRDQAFSRLDGLIPALARNYVPQLVSWSETYPGVVGLTWNGSALDRRLLSGLDRAAWNEVTADVKTRLTDAALAAAVDAMPPELRAKNGERLLRELKSRRDRLADVAGRFYRLLARQVDVHGTDRADVATVEPAPGGGVLVSLAPRTGKAAGQPYFRRVFDRTETRELRLLLHGGDDDVKLTPKTGIEVIVVRGERAALASGTAVRPVRDSGELLRFAPWAGLAPGFGLFAGGGAYWYKWGLGYAPYASRLSARAGWAFGAGSGAIELEGDFRQRDSGAHATLFASGSGIALIRFFGYGNETSRPGDDRFYEVEQKQLRLEPFLHVPVAAHTVGSLGVVARYTRTELEEGRFITLARPYGSGSFGQAGFGARLTLDTRDDPAALSIGGAPPPVPPGDAVGSSVAAARRGFRVEVGATVFPKLWDVETAYAEVHGEASAHVTAPIALEPTLAVRAGGKSVSSGAPYFDAAFVGGADTVRGLPEQRFAGRSSLYASAELRLFLTRFFLLLPGELGVFGLTDTGRVFASGESSGRWHSSVGGGLWFAFLSRASTVTIAVARSEERTGVYARAGFGF